MTILKEKVLEECEDIDFGVVADGEHTIIDLCKSNGGYEKIPGLIHKNKGKIRFNGERPPVENLEAYTFPRYIKFNMKDYSKQIPPQKTRKYNI